MEHHINLISEMDTEQRFADLLRSLIHKFGLNQKKAIKINLTIDELASYACSTKSYIKKIITDFSQKGMITYQRGEITVLDKKKIEAVAFNEKNPVSI
jgi:CRP-like cAMP-binding protein